MYQNGLAGFVSKGCTLLYPIWEVVTLGGGAVFVNHGNTKNNRRLLRSSTTKMEIGVRLANENGLSLIAFV
uniref:Uncharacterized protein n=1 Tax=Romanomermis culicivorax TaxID=13658 RepID=A0A915I8D6_ROMCU